MMTIILVAAVGVSCYVSYILGHIQGYDDGAKMVQDIHGRKEPTM